MNYAFARKPAVIMIVGVNGGGKTTSLGKTWIITCTLDDGKIELEKEIQSFCL